MPTLPTAAVIGAGSSGIAAAKALHERGLPFTCFEASDRVGGNWVFANKNGMSAAYRQLFINTSRDRMEYSDYPMPKSYPDFPHHAQIAAYFDAYVDHFRFRDRMRFETKVQHAARLEGGGWELTLDDGSVECFDALLVANGHHWDPRWPEPMFPGHDTFTGQSMFGRPVDQLPQDPRVPFKVRQRMIHALIKLHIGNPENYGLPAPDHRFGEAHPTVSGRILDRISHGTIAPKPNIRRLDGDEVEFHDSSREHVDVVVYCTGYKISFPFFDEDFISAPDNHIELFRRVFHPEVDDVFFVALLQPLGATMPLAEAQGQWIVDHLKGEYALPTRPALLQDIEDDTAAMRKRYVASKRHTIQVDIDDYLHALQKERRAGAERARRQGFRLPVAPGVGRERVAV